MMPVSGSVTRQTAASKGTTRLSRAEACANILSASGSSVAFDNNMRRSLSDDSSASPRRYQHRNRVNPSNEGWDGQQALSRLAV
jgi:hypothetical protein